MHTQLLSRLRGAIFLPALSLAALFSVHAAAQTSSCQTAATLNLSTGWNNTYTTALPAGSVDGSWTYTNATPLLQAAAGVPASGNTYTFAAHGTLGNPTGASWISCSQMNYISTTDRSDFAAYSMIAQRSFNTCKADSLTFDFTVYADDYITSFSIDGIAQSAISTIGANNWTNGNRFSKTIYLPAGLHNIKLQACDTPFNVTYNYYGLCVKGQVSSAHSSLLMPATNTECSCTPAQTGVTGTKKNEDFVLLPNPANSKLDIQIPEGAAKGNIRLAVVDLQGRELITGNLFASTAPNSFSVNISQLPAGLYMVQLIANDQVIGRKKFVVQH